MYSMTIWVGRAPCAHTPWSNEKEVGLVRLSEQCARPVHVNCR
jgi:hypothetical protein